MCPVCCGLFSMCARLLSMPGHKGRKTHTSLSVINFFSMFAAQNCFLFPFFSFTRVNGQRLGRLITWPQFTWDEDKESKERREREGENWESSPTWEATDTQGLLLHSFCVCVRALPCVLVNPLRSYQTINDGLNAAMVTFTHKTRTTDLFVVFKNYFDEHIALNAGDGGADFITGLNDPLSFVSGCTLTFAKSFRVDLWPSSILIPVLFKTNSTNLKQIQLMRSIFFFKKGRN